MVEAFLRDGTPRHLRRDLRFKAMFVLAVVTGMGAVLSSKPMPQKQAQKHARECARMLADYLGLRG
ncbi:MAG: hypothetical protein K8T26_11175 [Lentisphaerae bacterium]|nr:hypothetical protein [Lentisphaerota bacterium]